MVNKYNAYFKGVWWCFLREIFAIFISRALYFVLSSKIIEHWGLFTRALSFRLKDAWSFFVCGNLEWHVLIVKIVFFPFLGKGSFKAFFYLFFCSGIFEFWIEQWMGNISCIILVGKWRINAQVKRDLKKKKNYFNIEG